MKTAILRLLALAAFFLACNKEEPANPTPTTPAKATAKAITKFSFTVLSPPVDATIDETTKTIKATVPATADLTKLAPSISVSDKASVSPSSGVTQDFSKEVSYTVTAEDGSKQEYKVSVTKMLAVKSSAKNILSLTFKETSPAVNGNVDTLARTIGALLPAGTNLTKLTPTITVSEKATINPASGVAKDFSQPVPYTVTAEDGTTQVFLVSAVTDASYYSNIRLTVNEDNGNISVNDSSILDLRTGKVYPMKDGVANAANADFILNGYCALELVSPALVIYNGVTGSTSRINSILSQQQKWTTYRKSFVDVVHKNEVTPGDYGVGGQIVASEWDRVSFAKDIKEQFSVGRALTIKKDDEFQFYLDGSTDLVISNNSCIPVTITDKLLYRFLTQEGKKGLLRVKKFGKTDKGGYYVIIDFKIEK